MGMPESVPFPDVADTALVFDVEVLVTESPYPVMATAVSGNAWYSWVSPWLAGTGDGHESPEHLIPMGPKNGTAPPRLLISHNAGFDRAAVLDEYTLQSSSIRWMDTMSLHVATSGISSPQRAEWQKHARRRSERRLKQLLAAEQVEDDTKELIRTLLEDGELDDESLAALRVHNLEGWTDEVKNSMDHQLELMEASMDTSEESSLMSSTAEEQSSVLWQDVTSRNSLADVAALHCKIEMDKEARNKFIDGTPLAQIREECASLLLYCAKDVATTHAVFSKVWPVFTERCPHPATVAGVFALGSTFLPVDESWLSYQKQSDAKFDEMNAGVVATLKHLAHTLKHEGVRDMDAYRATGRGDPWWETDPWYAQLDWEPKRPKKGALPEVLEPAWCSGKLLDPNYKLGVRSALMPLLLQIRVDGKRVFPGTRRRWVMRDANGKEEELPASPLTKETRKKHHVTSGASREVKAAFKALVDEADAATVDQHLREVVAKVRDQGARAAGRDPQWAALDWTMKARVDESDTTWWPKWFWELYSSKDNELAITIRSKLAPLLLKLAWDKHPLYRSREHGWIYRTDDAPVGSAPLAFSEELDPHLARLDAQNPRVCFHKLPHGNGDGSNVGNPFSKGFLPYFESKRLESLHPSEAGEAAAKHAVEMNAMCSYWISVRDRVEKQRVVWDGEASTKMGFGRGRKRGLILPQVITMGTVTRRAIEKTWLTASNAKPNRIGSELKAMVRAPPGWCIVGADVDSEELWICSVMGDAQFGIHGATAIGWMTLEGSKAHGTDLHSKTASILGTSRNHAKVFNYSRIYGAGIRHAMQLLLKANPSMPPAEANERAKQLYAATKGQSTYSSNLFGRKFWFGGSESYVFNKLEEIATSDNPRTPALDCGITAALSKKYLPRTSDGSVRQDYMPSRVNWVVQSSGVDYLHLLITAMDHLCRTYDIRARFMLSVHDEVRYLAREEDRFRTALALQIANLWTRAMFAYKLNMDDLPESCAWFAEVDIDHVLRKEVQDPCVTPSQPVPIPPGQTLAIADILRETHGSLLASPRARPRRTHDAGVPAYVPSDQQHRCVGRDGLLFLQAQGSTDLDEVRALDRRARLHGAPESLAETLERLGDESDGERRGAGARAMRAARPGAAAARPSRPCAPRRTMHTGRAPPPLEALAAMLPPRPIRVRRPFFRQSAHRRSVLGVYADLLRATRRIPAPLRAEVRRDVARDVRVRRRLRTSRAVWDACASARALAAEMRAYATSDAARAAVDAYVARHRARRARRAPAERARPKAFVTGALLPPTLYNPPMLRYKPEQPLKITMMIRDRRRRREKRLQRWDEVQEMKRMIRDEHRGGAREIGAWSAPLEAWEREMQAQFAREHARSRMVFDVATLRRAKEARRRRAAYHAARASRATARGSG
ncbi:DNA-directed DNA polymerase [Malassezia obtusa]|uniref:DNA-directed DNA polymerase n=1 Tax=Malassezia obtusa TaxID=76774 RepID=A0AAF0E4R0_9BASI|nr:DNA-directed DNA polymerase [Malassezia obtusa]